MKESVVAIVFIMLTEAWCFATAQYPDIIIYENQEYSMQTNPLEFYFNKNNGKRPKTRAYSTALRRGYIAKFEITNKELFLVDIMIPQMIRQENGKDKEIMISVFVESFPNDQKIKVDWFDGILVLPYGKLKNRVHMGYASTFENYILISIQKGNVIEVRNYAYEEYISFKNRQFEKYKVTKQYQEQFETLMKQGFGNSQLIEEFIKEYVIVYTKEFIK